MIKTQSLRVDYDDVEAVSDLDLDIQAGQVYGLVGPNGAGKTSTIKAICGVIEPTYGDVRINGVDLAEHPAEALQQLGYMPDFLPVYEHLKVWEYLDVFAAAHLISKKQRPERIQFWLEETSLIAKRNAFVRQLSRGMRQRLVLAKTLLHNPKVICLDEPASGLDPVSRRQVRAILKRVAQDGATVLISSHILSELSDLCTSIGIMEKGHLIVSGSIDEIRARIGAKKILRISLAQTDESVLTKCQNFLRNTKSLTNIQTIDAQTSEAVFTGDDNDASWLLAQLVKQDFPVSNFQITQANVEDIFFEIGANEVS